MSRHLTIKPAAPWHWDGHDPLDKPIVARPVCRRFGKPCTLEEASNCVLCPDETWDMDGLGR